jgi:hypothetical protein
MHGYRRGIGVRFTRRLKPASVVALLLVGACAIFLVEPWHGPVVLSLSRTHGIDTGDLPALALIALAVVVASVCAPAVRPEGRGAAGLWAGPASAVVLGALLLVGGVKLTGIVRLGALDDARGVLVIIAAVWFGVALAAGRRPGARRRSWWQPAALFIAGSVVDAALAPSGTLFGPILVALWLARTASHRGAAATMYLLGAVLTAVSLVSLVDPGGPDLSEDDGGVARSAALGLLLVTAGLLDVGYRSPDGGTRGSSPTRPAERKASSITGSSPSRTQFSDGGRDRRRS